MGDEIEVCARRHENVEPMPLNPTVEPRSLGCQGPSRLLKKILQLSRTVPRPGSKARIEGSMRHMSTFSTPC